MPATLTASSSREKQGSGTASSWTWTLPPSAGRSMRRGTGFSPALECRATARGSSSRMRKSPNSNGEGSLSLLFICRSSLRTGLVSDRIPISIVTGFLGSGKTTLIAALLEQQAMQDTAIVVNEFGAIGIDDAVFAQTLDANNVVLLANGCLCCAVGDDLASTIWALAMRPCPPRRIVVETSGLAEPAPLLRRLMADPRLKQSTRLDAIVATVDAVNGLENLEEQPVALRQCAVADRRLITKVDLVDAAHVARLSNRLFALNRGASVAAVSRGAIDASMLFGAALYDERRSRSDLDRWLNLD